MLYNGMIAPLLPYAIKGAIWYQGESNAGRGYQYRALLPAMITDWRARFGVGDFPFYIVSLANFQQPPAQPSESDWAELREAQAMTAKNLKNCGLAVAIDIGDAVDIHPKNKMEVGRRLALAALAQVHGREVEYSGPWYKGMTVEDGRIRLAFDHAAGLAAKDGRLTGFAIAGEDRKFVWADAVIDGGTVVVSAVDVPKPVAVRYAWHANPVCNLVNAAGLLCAILFRTDDWPGDGEQQVTGPVGLDLGRGRNPPRRPQASRGPTPTRSRGRSGSCRSDPRCGHRKPVRRHIDDRERRRSGLGAAADHLEKRLLVRGIVDPPVVRVAADDHAHAGLAQQRQPQGRAETSSPRIRRSRCRGCRPSPRAAECGRRAP
ncbi:MAG: sialate O-acetylesterase [Kiritimatiellia bacterium]